MEKDYFTPHQACVSLLKSRCLKLAADTTQNGPIIPFIRPTAEASTVDESWDSLEIVVEHGSLLPFVTQKTDDGYLLEAKSECKVAQAEAHAQEQQRQEDAKLRGSALISTS